MRDGELGPRRLWLLDLSPLSRLRTRPHVLLSPDWTPGAEKDSLLWTFLTVSHVWTWTFRPGTHRGPRDGAPWADVVSLSVAASVAALLLPQCDGSRVLAAPL